MNVAIIDLGTNTFNILIVNIEKDKKLDILLKTKSAVMLGSEGLMTGYLSDKAFVRSFAVLRDYSGLIKDFECERVIAYGTSAIRHARNSNKFIEKVHNELGIQITPISGDEESKYMFTAISNAIPMDSKNYLMLDIGGGNNELVIGNGDQVLWSNSYELGSARLLELIKPEDPISAVDIDKLLQYFDEQMPDFNEALHKYPVERALGSAGAFDTFAEMISQKKRHKPLPLNSRYYNFTIDDFNDIYKTIITTTSYERTLIPGLETLRKDTIVMAAVFVKYVFDKAQIRNIVQSGYALTEGVALQEISKLQ